MKKLLSCLLAAAMLFTMASAIAAEPFEPIERNNALVKFLNETDTKTKDIALQLQFGDDVADLVLRAEGDNFHVVARDNGTQKGHLQLTPEALFVTSNGSVKQLKYATVVAFMQDIVKTADALVNEAIDSIPQQEVPSEAELAAAAAKAEVIASMAAAQQQADAATLFSAGASFASKFKAENILDVKENDDSVEISLRSEAYASALADAIDDLMLDPALAELVDRKAAATGGKTFASIQKDWIVNREATLEAIRTIQSTDLIEDGHWKSHFQIGEKTEEEKDNEVLVCDVDTWINDDADAAEMVLNLGFQDADPLMVYEMAVNPSRFWEKVTAQNSEAEIRYDIEEGRLSGGFVKAVVEGNEELYAEFSPDYMYMKGANGGFFSSVRETWTGKIRYELVAETAQGAEASMTVDFYEDGDSLVCELRTGESDQSLMFKLSRIDRIDIEDLSAAENVELTEETLKAEFENILKTVLPAQTANP